VDLCEASAAKLTLQRRGPCGELRQKDLASLNAHGERLLEQTALGAANLVGVKD
jgi:hypothetical protein